MRRLREQHHRLLGNGWRERPAQMDRHYETICETCTYYATDPSHTPVLLRSETFATVSILGLVAHQKWREKRSAEGRAIKVNDVAGQAGLNDERSRDLDQATYVRLSRARHQMLGDHADGVLDKVEVERLPVTETQGLSSSGRSGTDRQTRRCPDRKPLVNVPDPRSRPTISVIEAGQLFGFGNTKSYDEAHRYLRSGGREGLPTIRFGRSLVCPTARLLALLGIYHETAA